MTNEATPPKLPLSDGLASKPPERPGDCQLAEHRMCCCKCKHHIRDFHHCTTVQMRPMGKCVCSYPKGWICMPPEFEGAAFSGWTEHGLCEMWEKAPPPPKKAQPGRAAGGKARSIVLTATRRKEIAVNAAKARWSK